MSKIGVFGIWTLFIPLFCIAAASYGSESTEVVKLPPFRVDGGLFDVSCSYTPDKNTLLSVKVSWVSPKLKKSGLDIGDTLSSVDGVPIKGMLLSDYLASISDQGKTGEKSVLVFTRSRGLFRRTITLTLPGERPKQPNKSPEPTP